MGHNQLERERGKEREREGEMKKETETGKERRDRENSLETTRSIIGSRDTVWGALISFVHTHHKHMHLSHSVKGVSY